MHNMIVEDATSSLEYESMGDPIKFLDQNPVTFEKFIQMHRQIQHRATEERAD